jgi:hypothetical protein
LASGLQDFSFLLLSRSQLPLAVTFPLTITLSLGLLFTALHLVALASLTVATFFSLAFGVIPAAGLVAERTPGEGDFLQPFCRGGDTEGAFGDTEVTAEATGFAGRTPGDGDFDFFCRTARPVIMRSLLLTDFSPL